MTAYQRDINNLEARDYIESALKLLSKADDLLMDACEDDGEPVELDDAEDEVDAAMKHLRISIVKLQLAFMGK